VQLLSACNMLFPRTQAQCHGSLVWHCGPEVHGYTAFDRGYVTGVALEKRHFCMLG
jgi:hypothetical protein